MSLLGENQTRALPAIAAVLAVASVVLLLRVLAEDESPSVQLFASETAPASQESRPVSTGLRVLVASMVSPRSTMGQYSGLVQLLGESLGRPAQLVLRKGYAEGNSALDSDEADIAFVCTGAFLRDRQHGRTHHPLVVPVVAGLTTYHSQILEPAESPARSLADLRGKRMAYVDPLSLTGYLWVLERIKGLQGEGESFFAATQYIGSHDRSVQAVAAGLADAAAVDSLTADSMLAQDPVLRQRLRVLERSPEFGSPPVVARASMRDSERKAITSALLALGSSPRGAAFLRDIGIERFVPVPADHFASAGALGDL